ncbi:hypothetical protein B0H21DRAFT_806805 [Amylocystis lapponica]|nr:hypothetical protein B0H21DRAFT_806805 [Amylocystis lapponica]
MSDSEGDISDELLELAGATEKKRKKRQAQSKSSKRRKADVKAVPDSDADQPESEEEDEANPYPLEGKYADEADRHRLMQMSEIEREDILAQRLEEMQRILDKRNLDQMLKAQSGRKGEESVAKAAKRQHAVRGATKEKSRKLDELKAKRKEKDEKKRTRTNSPKRDPSSSPVDMEMSDEEEEDGQISKFEEQEERERKLLNKVAADDEPITISDLNMCRLTRDQLVRYCMTPWFEDFVKGGFVRYLIGMEQGQPVYRICEVLNVGANPVKPYKIDNQTVDIELELGHGKSTKTFLMDKVSNSPFLTREFERLVRVLEHEKVKMPSRKALEKKAEQITKLANQRITESDIAAMLARKNANKPAASSATMERSRLTQARTLAYRRQDFTEVEAIDKQIAALAPAVPANGAADEESLTDVLARVNERNRKANLEQVRKAELQEAERKRRERKLAAKLSSRSVPFVLTHDPRVARHGTPGTNPGTPSLKADSTVATRSVSPLPPSALSGNAKPSSKSNFQASVIQSVEIDLGDF